MSQNWVKLVSPEEAPWTEVSLENVDDVDDLKSAIKSKLSPELDTFASVDFILKAKKSSESDEQVVELVNPREFIVSVRQSFGDNFRVIVSTSIQCRRIWVKLMNPKETPWTEVSLVGVCHVDGLKKVIKCKKSNMLKDYDAVQLVLKAKKSSESDEQAVELGDPRESIASVQQRFGDNYEVLVSVSTGK